MHTFEAGPEHGPCKKGCHTVNVLSSFQKSNINLWIYGPGDIIGVMIKPIDRIGSLITSGF